MKKRIFLDGVEVEKTPHVNPQPFVYVRKRLVIIDDAGRLNEFDARNYPYFVSRLRPVPRPRMIDDSPLPDAGRAFNAMRHFPSDRAPVIYHEAARPCSQVWRWFFFALALQLAAFIAGCALAPYLPRL